MKRIESKEPEIYVKRSFKTVKIMKNIWLILWGLSVISFGGAGWLGPIIKKRNAEYPPNYSLPLRFGDQMPIGVREAIANAIGRKAFQKPIVIFALDDQCSACQDLARSGNEFVRQYGERISFVGVLKTMGWRSSQRVANFIQTNKCNYPVLDDSRIHAMQSLLGKGSTVEYPTAFLFRKDGGLLTEIDRYSTNLQKWNAILDIFSNQRSSIQVNFIKTIKEGKPISDKIYRANVLQMNGIPISLYSLAAHTKGLAILSFS